jgi:diguanylate cyclase (GGDEF)-like protein
MPSSGAPAPPRLPIEDSYLELLSDTLASLDLPARGQFLQRYFRAITHLDLRESQCIQLWDEMLTRRRELADFLGRPVALKTALMDVLSSAGLFRVPIIIEYDDLKKLQLNAVTDPLTGLYNRRLFTETFEKELNRAHRYGTPLGLVILDLHRFKEVNDKHGHPRGDDVLRAAATTLRKALRTSDFAFRTGGDEFALLLPQTDAAQAVALSRRVATVFAETLLPLQLAVSVGMDHGVATYPQDGEQADQLIHVADDRLYRLKHTNHVRASEPPPRPPTPASDPPTSQPAAAGAPSPTPTPKPEPPAAQPISIESRRAPEKTQPNLAAASSVSAAGMAGSTEPLADSHRVYAIQRRAERVSMIGTNAYAVLGDQGDRRARVLDLGFGGVALELESSNDLADSVMAVLHVPILPPVRVNLKPVWSQKTTRGAYRVGCSFIS